jgi:putative peptidoglycan lipid II flippase
MARVYRSVSLVFALSLIAKALGFSRDIFLVNRMGVGAGTDAFYVAFNIVDFFILFSGLNALRSVATTTFTQERAASHDTSRYVSSLIYCVGGYGLLLALPLLLVPELLVRIFLPGFSPADVAMTATCLRILALAILLRGSSQIFGSLLGVKRKFGVYNMLMVVVNGAAVGAILLSPSQRVIVNLCWAITLAYGLAALVAYLILAEPGSRLVRVAPPTVREHGVRFVRLAFPLLFITTAFSLAGIVDKAVASFFPKGVITTLSLAYTVSIFPLTLLLVPISDVFFPHFSKQYQQGDLRGLERDYNRAQLLVIVLIIPTVLFMMFFSHEITAAAFYRRNFSLENVTATAQYLFVYSFALLFNGLYWLTAFLFQGAQKNGVLGRIGVAGYAVNIAGSVGFSLLWGPIGIPIGSVCAFAFFLLAGHVAIRKHLSIAMSRELYVLAAVLLAVAVMAGLSARGALAVLPQPLIAGPFEHVVTLLLAGMLYGCVVLAVGFPLVGRRIIGKLRMATDAA